MPPTPASRVLASALLILSACGGAPPRATVRRSDADRVEPPLPPLPWDLEEPAMPALDTPLVALVGGTVMTAAGQVIEDGVVVLDDGLIRAVGARAEVAIPSGARLVDTRGRFVTPGIIDTHSHMGVYPVPSLEAHSDGNEATSPTTPEVRAADSFWPQDPALGRAVAAGVTTIQVLPGSANLIGGAGETFHLHPGRTATEMMFPGAPPTMKMACGENPKRVYGEQHQAPSTRMGNVAGYRQAFQEAIEYGRTWEHWQREHQAWERDHGDASDTDTDTDTESHSDTDTDTDTGPPVPPARDFGHELLLGAMQGRVLVQMHCYRADEMARMIEVGREMGFRVRSFHHAVEAYKIRDLLHGADISISTWADWWGFKIEAFDAVPENLGLLTEAGVRGVMHSDSPMLVQRLNQEVGKAVTAARARGIAITDDQALRWLTANPAWTLGIDDRVGTLEAGRVADVVVWSAHPFSVYAHADLVFVDGLLEHERSVDPVGRRSDFELGLDLEPRVAATRAAARPELPVRTRPSRPFTGREELAITDVRVLTGEVGPGAVIERATVVVAADRITRVLTAGGVLSVPTVVDGRGLVLTPGFVAVETHLGMAEIELETGTRDTGHESEPDPIRASFTAVDGYNPLSTLIPIARLGGVVAAVSTPEGGLVPGTSSFVDLAGRDRSVVRAERSALHVDLTEGGVGAAHGARPAAIGRLRELFDDARLFARQRAAFDRAQMRETHVSRLDLERVVLALEGELPVVVRVSRAADILGVLALASDYGLRLVLSGVEEGWMVAEAIAAARVPAIVQPLSDLPSHFAALHSRFDNAALLADAGVEVILYEPGAWDVRNLRQEAGNAVAWGMDPAAALAAISSVPARVFGQGDDYGVIAPGRVASMVLWSGDPFETTTSPVHVYVRGRELPLRSRQTELFERYRDLETVRRGLGGASATTSPPR